MRKYNSCLSSLVSNYRDEADKVGLSTARLSNEAVFNLIEANSGFSTAEEDLEAFLDALRAATTTAKG